MGPPGIPHCIMATPRGAATPPLCLPCPCGHASCPSPPFCPPSLGHLGPPPPSTRHQSSSSSSCSSSSRGHAALPPLFKTFGRAAQPMTSSWVNSCPPQDCAGRRPGARARPRANARRGKKKRWWTGASPLARADRRDRRPPDFTTINMPHAPGLPSDLCLAGEGTARLLVRQGVQQPHSKAPKPLPPFFGLSREKKCCPLPSRGGASMALDAWKGGCLSPPRQIRQIR